MKIDDILEYINRPEPKKTNKKKTKRTSKLMDHQIPSFVELEPDEYHNGERHSSEPILHARDVLEDPEDFNIVFESILTVFRAGHNHEEDDDT
jgi:CRISPR/Cas system CSM-associated protein Csm4 (group 5 of RAMP superfamily)